MPGDRNCCFSSKYFLHQLKSDSGLFADLFPGILVFLLYQH